ncbi:hypothetical protein CDD83_9553 [Cordyceps sp. RAO-2017]|nr:hypothetical protein CDD83_9553 [Cordyceps sp. RAO-2017]
MEHRSPLRVRPRPAPPRPGGPARQPPVPTRSPSRPPSPSDRRRGLCPPRACGLERAPRTCSSPTVTARFLARTAYMPSESPPWCRAAQRARDLARIPRLRLQLLLDISTCFLSSIHAPPLLNSLIYRIHLFYAFTSSPLPRCIPESALSARPPTGRVAAGTPIRRTWHARLHHP